MTDINRALVEDALKGWVEPHLGKDLVSAQAVRDVAVDGDKVTIDLELGFPVDTVRKSIVEAVSDAVRGLDGVSEVEVNLASSIHAHVHQKGMSGVSGVKNIIAIASGKGGVGKSTTAVNLALALSAAGARVGMLDADIYGPSQPRMLGISGKPDSHDGKKLEPLVNYGLQAMSAGFLIDEETPMVWRGPWSHRPSSSYCVTPTGGTSTTWWLICHPAPVTSS